MTDKQKKETSYTYWVEKNDNFFNGIEVDCKPQKIECTPEPVVVQTAGQSQWNKSGTWEEKKIDIQKLKPFVEESVKKYLQQQLINIENVDISGEGSVVYSNKKVKPGYNLDLKIDYKNQSGTIKFSQFQDDGDYDISIQDDNSQLKSQIDKESTQIVKLIQESIKEYAQQI